jgi:hypothetical protein
VVRARVSLDTSASNPPSALERPEGRADTEDGAVAGWTAAGESSFLLDETREHAPRGRSSDPLVQSLRGMRRWVCLSFLAVGLACGVACGPSFQVMYEGDSRFEHCYALDENPNVLMQQKSDC